MKLRPTQIVGLIAIVVFGGILIFRVTQPSERQVMEDRLRSLPSIPAPEFKVPPLDITVPTMPDLNAPPSPEIQKAVRDEQAADDARQFALGSQDAKDDFYCSGVLNAEMYATKGAEAAEKLLDQSRALDEAGMARLKKENVAELDQPGNSLKHEDKGRADHAAKTLRIPVATCVARAAALPPATH